MTYTTEYEKRNGRTVRKGDGDRTILERQGEARAERPGEDSEKIGLGGKTAKENENGKARV